MRNDLIEELNQEIEIDVSKAVEAYDMFRPDVSGHEASDDSGPKAARFNRAIQAVMDEMRAPYERGETCLGSKQTMSNWRKGEVKGRVTRRRSILLSVLALTKIDISKRNILAREPINFSPLVELSTLTAHKLTNNPEEIEEVSYSVILSSLLFKAARMRVMSSWLKKLRRGDKDPEIGSVDYSLLEADISIEVEDGELTYWVRRIPGDDSRDFGRTDGCIVLWSDQNEAWLIQPQFTGDLRARIEAVGLCSVLARRGAMINIYIRASRDQVEDEFRIRDQSTRALKDLGEDELSRARSRLIGLVLGQRADDTAVLAMQRYKLP